MKLRIDHPYHSVMSLIPKMAVDNFLGHPPYEPTLCSSVSNVIRKAWTRSDPPREDRPPKNRVVLTSSKMLRDEDYKSSTSKPNALHLNRLDGLHIVRISPDEKNDHE